MAERQPHLILPAYNEAATIGEVVREVAEVYEHVVVVDDGSTDATGAEARAAGATVLRHAVNRGQGAALQTGIAYSLRRGARCVVTFDSDGQHRVADVAKLLEPIRRGEAEIVLGSRFLGTAPRIPWFRRGLLRCAVVFTWAVSGVRLTDAHNGLRAFSRRVAKRLDIRLDRMAHASEMVDQIRRMGLPYVEVPVEIRYTRYSRAKGQNASAAVRIAFDYLFERLFR